MATLQKLRSKSAILLVFIGLALFAFIAEEFVRSLTSSKAEANQRIGEVAGETISHQEFSELADGELNAARLMQIMQTGDDKLTQEQEQQARDAAWNSYVMNTLVEKECKELGLSVSEEEAQKFLIDHCTEILQNSNFTQLTGITTFTDLQQFLNETYPQMMENQEMPTAMKERYTYIYKYWQYIEKKVAQSLLQEKYNTLLSQMNLSTPAAIKSEFDARTIEKSVVVASLPYTLVDDNDVKVSDSELEAKYETMKEQFFKLNPECEIKYIDVTVLPSETDRMTCLNEVKEAAQKMEEGADISTTVRKAHSKLPYKAYPVSIETIKDYTLVSQIQSMEPGDMSEPIFNPQDTTYNVVRLIAKENLPDSIQILQIQLPGTDEAALQLKVDTIMAAYAEGIPFDSLARQYKQANASADTIWFETKDFESAKEVLSEDYIKMLTAIERQQIGTVETIKLGGGIMLSYVIDRRKFEDKYEVAIVKSKVEASDETNRAAFNALSQFVAQNKTIEDIEANAMKSNYQVQQQTVQSNAFTVANVPSTRDALHWIFNKDTQAGEISDIYTANDSRRDLQHYLVVALVNRNEGEYSDLTSNNVRDAVRAEVEREKRGEVLTKKLSACKDIESVMNVEGASVDSLEHVTYAVATSVPSLYNVPEPILSAAISKAAKGNFVKGVKGQAGVYSFKVLEQATAEAKMEDKKAEIEQALETQYGRNIGGVWRDVARKLGVQDNRYLFY